MRSRAGWLLLAGLALSCFSLAAQATTEAGNRAADVEAEPPSEGENGMLLLWKWANFALLAGALGYVISKNAGPFFANRTLQIRKGMIEAEELRAEAEARVAAVDARLSNLQVEIEALRQEAQAEAAAETERIRQETAAELAKIQANARQEVASLGKAARLELKRHGAQLAIALAEQKIRSRISAETQALLVRRFAKEVAQSASQVQST